jgi:hypothetical protein
MACCAFVAFLIAQIYLVLDSVSARIGLRRKVSAGPTAADWRLVPLSVDVRRASDLPRIAPPSRLQILSRRLILLGSIFALSFAVSLVLIRPSPSAREVWSGLRDPASWCSSRLPSDTRPVRED